MQSFPPRVVGFGSGIRLRESSCHSWAYVALSVKWGDDAVITVQLGALDMCLWRGSYPGGLDRRLANPEPRPQGTRPLPQIELHPGRLL